MKRFTRTPFPKKYNSQLNEDETFSRALQRASNVSGKKVRGFIRTKEDFVCEKCGARVTGSGYTNHCPKCLWSKHVDQNPGDRASLCKGSMAPLSVRVSSDGACRILHRCDSCGFIRAQTAAANDDMERLIKFSTRPFEK